jgi:hypothetical protein
VSKDTDISVGSLFKAILRKHPSFMANPIGDWSEIVGVQVARYSHPVSLKKKALLIIAYDSVWKHHLELNKEAILEKINQKSREALVEKISIRVGQLPASGPILNPNYKLLEKKGAKHSPVRRQRKTPARQLTPEEMEVLKGITDPELKAISTRLLKRMPLDNPS